MGEYRGFLQWVEGDRAGALVTSDDGDDLYYEFIVDPSGPQYRRWRLARPGLGLTVKDNGEHGKVYLDNPLHRYWPFGRKRLSK